MEQLFINVIAVLSIYRWKARLDRQALLRVSKLSGSSNIGLTISRHILCG